MHISSFPQCSPTFACLPMRHRATCRTSATGNRQTRSRPHQWRHSPTIPGSACRPERCRTCVHRRRRSSRSGSRGSNGSTWESVVALNETTFIDTRHVFSARPVSLLDLLFYADGALGSNAACIRTSFIAYDRILLIVCRLHIRAYAACIRSYFKIVPLGGGGATPRVRLNYCIKFLNSFWIHMHLQAIQTYAK